MFLYRPGRLQVPPLLNPPSNSPDKYEFDLTNQDGTRLALAPEDRKALVMGLALHAQGQATLTAAAKSRQH